MVWLRPEAVFGVADAELLAVDVPALTFLGVPGWETVFASEEVEMDVGWRGLPGWETDFVGGLTLAAVDYFSIRYGKLSRNKGNQNKKGEKYGMHIIKLV